MKNLFEKFDGESCGGGLYAARVRFAARLRFCKGDSSSSTPYTTTNQQVAAQGHGIALGAYATGNSITTTDYGAVQAAGQVVSDALLANEGTTEFAIQGQTETSKAAIAGNTAVSQSALNLAGNVTSNADNVANNALYLGGVVTTNALESNVAVENNALAGVNAALATLAATSHARAPSAQSVNGGYSGSQNFQPAAANFQPAQSQNTPAAAAASMDWTPIIVVGIIGAGLFFAARGR